MSLVFNKILLQPLFNILIFFYDLSGDFGVAIILLTTLIRLVLYPLSAKAIRSQKELSVIQPQIQEVQRKHKGDQAAQAKELMKLYQEHNINPFSGCLPILIQLPILVALYRVFLDGLDPAQLVNLYYFIPKPDLINPEFLGFLDLSGRNLFLALAAGAFQFWQSKASLPQQDKKGVRASPTQAIMSKQMLYFFPALTVIISASLPAGVALYWLTTTILGLIQHFLVKIKPKQQTTLQN
ncbi:protein translocase component YidC [Candidatus Parcubacteria bacterium]|nr:MAG: protein translocase component YidC [Candidatus Parcubacteria bacterium]